MKETNLNEFGLSELDYILYLDNQLYDNLSQIYDRLSSDNYNENIDKVLSMIDILMVDTTSHAIKIKEAKDYILKDMESANRQED